MRRAGTGLFQRAGLRRTRGASTARRRRPLLDNAARHGDPRGHGTAKSNSSIAAAVALSERSVEKHAKLDLLQARAERGEGPQPARQGRAPSSRRANEELRSGRAKTAGTRASTRAVGRLAPGASGAGPGMVSGDGAVDPQRGVSTVEPQVARRIEGPDQLRRRVVVGARRCPPAMAVTPRAGHARRHRRRRDDGIARWCASHAIVFGSSPASDGRGRRHRVPRAGGACINQIDGSRHSRT